MSEEIFVSDGRLEAKVVSTTQNDKGWYVRLFLHPNDAAEVTKLRYGAVLDIRWREVLNVEVEPIEVENPQGAPLTPSTVPRPQADKAGTLPKPKQRFADMPLSQQCAMRCEDAEFKDWIYSVKKGAKAFDVAANVRSLCDVVSRSHFDRDPEIGGRWRKLNAEYEAWRTDQRHAESIRR